MPQVFFVKMWQNCCQSIGKDSQQVVGKERPAEAVIVSIHGTVHTPNLRLKLARKVWLCGVCVCMYVHVSTCYVTVRGERAVCCVQNFVLPPSKHCLLFLRLAHPLLECHHSRGTGVGGPTPTHLPTLLFRFSKNYS